MGPESLCTESHMRRFIAVVFQKAYTYAPMHLPAFCADTKSCCSALQGQLPALTVKLQLAV